MGAAHDIDHVFRDVAAGAQRLKGIAVFGRFDDDELAKVYQLGRLVTLKAKSNAVVEGEPTRGLYLVLSGRVSVYKTDPSTGAMARLAFLEEGANFGEISLFDTAPRSATVVAETSCHLFLLDADDFHRFLREAGVETQVRFYRTCAEELAVRFRNLNGDFLESQRLLWKYALRR